MKKVKLLSLILSIALLFSSLAFSDYTINEESMSELAVFPEVNGVIEEPELTYEEQYEAIMSDEFLSESEREAALNMLEFSETLT